ncbi:hypothetical protein BJF79_03575 [Actinomadura sp. CNU-125]|uniref:hypothetical protein n=1 Tax=Actinomadura sp. CNU-125 TaxID=1904961 RepID=UPI00095BC3B5|nr:hypothetical protein [Actinomadura sp. CNU-125]OLT12992.1 hypothetical protein BJF79_03575 [Actinomadura sp. CNU-125]
MEARIYQAWVETGPALPRPTVRIYQAYGQTVDAPPPLTVRIYQAWVTAAAGGVGTLRIYQAWVTAALPADVVLSGIKADRGGSLGGVTARVFRNGGL